MSRREKLQGKIVEITKGNETTQERAKGRDFLWGDVHYGGKRGRVCKIEKKQKRRWDKTHPGNGLGGKWGGEPLRMGVILIESLTTDNQREGGKGGGKKKEKKKTTPGPWQKDKPSLQQPYLHNSPQGQRSKGEERAKRKNTWKESN